ncbi:Uncharacterised protein [uncultured archaeon]|nr:Uncharacterised protein [uncultured archaeon]
MLWGLKKKSILALFSLIFLAGALHSQVSWAISEADLYIWTALAIIICASFIGLAYMAARLFELSILEAWVKIEINELFASAVIAAFCIGLIASVNGAAQFLVGDNTADVTQSAQAFLANTLYADGRALYSKLGDAYFNLAKVTSYTYTAGISASLVSMSISQSPASGMSPLLSALGQAMDNTAQFMMLAAAQFSFLQFFASAATIMLPVGIFLRSFSLTRKIGGTLLAAVIASSVIYPASFFVAGEVYRAYRPSMVAKSGSISVAAAGDPPLANVVCNPFMQRFVQGPVPFLGGEMGWSFVICTPICIIPGIGQAACKTCYDIIQIMFYIVKSTFPIAMGAILAASLSGLGTDELMSGYYAPLLRQGLPAVTEYSVLSVVVFLIPLIIAISMLRNLAITFGGEPQLYGLSKLV